MIDDNQQISTDTPQPVVDGEEPRRRSRRRGRRGKSRGGASEQTEQQHEQQGEGAPVATAPPRPQPQEQPRPSHHNRQNRNPFSDGMDRQVCIAKMAIYPTLWPVNSRAGLAVQPLFEVGRSTEAILLCDLSHEGPCIWPEYLGWEPSPGFDAHTMRDSEFEIPVQEIEEEDPVESAEIDPVSEEVY